jgi:hypothetical protein
VDCAAAISGHWRWRTAWYGEQFKADPLSIQPQKVTPASSLHRRTPLWRSNSTDHPNPLWLCSHSSLDRATGCLMRWSLERRMEAGGSWARSAFVHQAHEVGDMALHARRKGRSVHGAQVVSVAAG